MCTDGFKRKLVFLVWQFECTFYEVLNMDVTINPNYEYFFMKLVLDMKEEDIQMHLQGILYVQLDIAFAYQLGVLCCHSPASSH